MLCQPVQESCINLFTRRGLFALRSRSLQVCSFDSGYAAYFDLYGYAYACAFCRTVMQIGEAPRYEIHIYMRSRFKSEKWSFRTIGRTIEEDLACERKPYHRRGLLSRGP